MENYNDEDLIAQEFIAREPIVAYGKKVFSIEEYLAYENASPEKHEYYNSEIFAMAGAGTSHNLIFRNLYEKLASTLKKSPCFPFGPDFRLHIPSNTLFTYPDISILCGDPYSLMPTETSASLPTVIIEILSPSTRKYDRGLKFELYKAIPTLKEYILVESEEVAIDIYRKNIKGIWELENNTAKDSQIKIKAVNRNIEIREIYTQVQFRPKKSKLSAT